MTTVPYTVVLQRNPDHQYFGLYICEDVPSGVYVATVDRNSPAAKANIQPGDRVLAINGQSVSSMTLDPQGMIIQIANRSTSITLDIQPSDILSLIGLEPVPSQPNFSHDFDLDKYLKSLVTSVPFSRHHYHRRRHRRRKRPSLRTIQTQTSFIDEPKENNQTLSERRSIPSMGTSHVLLRNSAQSSTKESETKEPVPENTPTTNNLVFTNPSPPPAPPPVEFPKIPQIQRLPSTDDDDSPDPSVHDDGLQEVHLRRNPNFQGYGFHIQYNKHFFLIHHIEPHSPAETSGLHEKDIVRKVNNQTTDHMSHKTFVQIINASTQVVFLVQNYEKYMRANPDVARKLNTRPPPPSMPQNENTNKNPSGLSRALSKLKSR